MQTKYFEEESETADPVNELLLMGLAFKIHCDLDFVYDSDGKVMLGYKKLSESYRPLNEKSTFLMVNKLAQEHGMTLTQQAFDVVIRYLLIGATIGYEDGVIGSINMPGGFPYRKYTSH